MLLEPWSTLGTVRNNINFLREFANDGAAAVSFCRTLPYAGTPIEGRLKAEGRLSEKDLNADYQFLDPRLDLFYDWLLDSFADRNYSAQGTSNLLRLLLFESHLDLPDRPSDPQLRRWAMAITGLSNQIMLDTVETALDHIESLQAATPEDVTLKALKSYHNAEDQRLRQDLVVMLQRWPDLQERLHLVCL